MQVILRICTHRDVHFLRWGGVDLTVYKMGGGEGASSSPSLGLFGQHDFRQRPISGVRPTQPPEAPVRLLSFASRPLHLAPNTVTMTPAEPSLVAIVGIFQNTLFVCSGPIHLTLDSFGMCLPFLFLPLLCCYCLDSKWPSRGKALEMKLFLLHV